MHILRLLHTLLVAERRRTVRISRAGLAVVDPHFIVQVQETIGRSRVGERPAEQAGGVEGAEEPIVRFGGGLEDRADRLRGIGLGREEEEPQPGGLRGGGGGGGIDHGAVVLVDHVLEVLVGGDGDEGVEVLARELVLEREGPVVQQRLGEVGGEGGEGGRVAVDDDHAGVAAHVAERLVVRARHDVPAVAAHQPELRRERVRRGGGGWWIPGFGGGA